MEMIVYFCQELGGIGLWGPEILEWHVRAGTLVEGTQWKSYDGYGTV